MGVQNHGGNLKNWQFALDYQAVQRFPSLHVTGTQGCKLETGGIQYLWICGTCNCGVIRAKAAELAGSCLTNRAEDPPDGQSGSLSVNSHSSGATKRAIRPDDPNG